MKTAARIIAVTGRTSRQLVAALLLVFAVGAAGCKSELYSGLAESEANGMMAVLMANGIDAEKQSGKDGYSIGVDKADLLRSMALLDSNGLPKQVRASMGSVFQKSGLMSSPFEERVRYIYALGEEVAQTLSQLDGVVAARVHIVLPDRPELGAPVKPSSAAVFIKHRAAVDLDFFVPQIRRLVSSSIEGLDYNAVTVVLAEAHPLEPAALAAQDPTVEVLPGVAVRSADARRFWTFIAIASVIASVLLATSIFGAVAYLRSRRGARERASTAVVAAMEPM